MWSIDVIVRQMRFYRWDAQAHAQRGQMGGYQDHKRFYNNSLKPKLVSLVARARLLGCPYNREADEEISRSFDFPTPKY